MFCDAQTSGGLLVSTPEKNKISLLKELHAQGLKCSTIIGRVTAKGTGQISVV
jgi:selenophosphate synthase